MKKTITIIITVIILASTVHSCEKDDICPSGSSETPLLIITFYDATNRELPKDVPTLRIIGEGQTNFLNTLEDFKDRETTDSIGIPLKSFETSTSFTFISNSADEEDTDIETGNSDIVTFSYINKEVFVSRGCGFINNYENLASSPNDGGDTRWIISVEVVNANVKNQDSTHVKIYH